MLPMIYQDKKALAPYEETHTEFVAANLTLPFAYPSLYTSLTARGCILIRILYLYRYTYIIHMHTCRELFLVKGRGKQQNVLQLRQQVTANSMYVVPKGVFVAESSFYFKDSLFWDCK